MMKKLIFIGGALVILIIVVLVFVISNIGPLIKKAVNTYGPEITKTDVRLEDVSVSLFSGEAKLKELHLGNPKGFKSPEALRVGSILLEVDKGSLTKDTIIIERIEILRPEISYERDRSTDNFQTIIANVNKSVGAGGAPKGTPEGEKAAKKLLIRDCLIKDGKINLSSPLLGDKKIATALPEIRLRNIGGDKGVSPEKAAQEILAALYAKITSPAVTNLLNEGLKSVGEDLKKQLEPLGKDAGKGVGEIADKMKGLLGTK
jgi:uncharacterized protein involved in outer membrane biogenesis